MTIGYFDPVVTQIIRLGRVLSFLGATLSLLSIFAIMFYPELWFILYPPGVFCILFAVGVLVWVKRLREKARESHPWMR